MYITRKTNGMCPIPKSNKLISYNRMLRNNLPLSLSLSHTHTHALSLSLSLSHTHMLFLSLSLAISHFSIQISLHHTDVINRWTMVFKVMVVRERRRERGRERVPWRSWTWSLEKWWPVWSSIKCGSRTPYAKQREREWRKKKREDERRWEK